MEIKNIINAIQAKRVNVTSHARDEARNDSLLLDEILFSTCDGEVIEDYPTDKPFPSCLIYGDNSDGDPVHTVWGYDLETTIAILITVYRPDPARWINWKQRKK